MIILNIIVKALETAAAGVEVYTVATKKNATMKEKINAVCQGLFATAQIGDATAVCFASNPNVNFGFDAATGISDIVRNCSQITVYKEQCGEKWSSRNTLAAVTQIGGAVFFRIGDVARADIADYPEDYSKFSETLAEGAQDAGIILGGATAAYRGRDLGSRIMELFERRKKAKMNARLVCLGISSDAAILASDKELLALSDVSVEEINRLINLKNQNKLNDIEEIPDWLFKICVYESTWHKCEITKKPIRFIVVPNLSYEQRKSSNKEARKVKYEKSKLEKWFKDNPGKAPQGWPKNFWPIPPGTQPYIEEILIQDQIDEWLEVSISDLEKDRDTTFREAFSCKPEAIKA